MVARGNKRNMIECESKHASKNDRPWKGGGKKFLIYMHNS